MKQLLLIALFIVGACGASQAQSNFGIKAGINLTRYAGGGTNDINPLVGWHAGITYNIPLSDDGFFSIQPELLYSQKGAKPLEQGARITSRLHYLDLPVPARVKAGGILLEAGPQLGYLLDQSGDFKNGAPAVRYGKIDFGYVAGVGYQFSQGYNFGVRYNGGLSRLFSATEGSLGTPRNAGFQVYGGYVFGRE